MNATADRPTEARCYCSDLQGVPCGTCRDAALNEWATSRAGTCRIRLYFDPARNGFSVYALDGHELLPVSKTFPNTPAGERDARAYANRLRATR